MLFSLVDSLIENLEKKFSASARTIIKFSCSVYPRKGPTRKTNFRDIFYKSFKFPRLPRLFEHIFICFTCFYLAIIFPFQAESIILVSRFDEKIFYFNTGQISFKLSFHRVLRLRKEFLLISFRP